MNVNSILYDYNLLCTNQIKTITAEHKDLTQLVIKSATGQNSEPVPIHLHPHKLSPIRTILMLFSNILFGLTSGYFPTTSISKIYSSSNLIMNLISISWCCSQIQSLKHSRITYYIWICYKY